MKDPYRLVIRRKVEQTIIIWAKSAQEAEDAFALGGIEYDIDHEKELTCEIKSVEPDFDVGEPDPEF